MEEERKPLIALGIEGSANKVCQLWLTETQCGVGIIRSDGLHCDILANIRKTYVPPAGSGFLPRETAWHHQQYVILLVRHALNTAKMEPKDIDIICFTKGRNSVVCSFQDLEWGDH